MVTLQRKSKKFNTESIAYTFVLHNDTVLRLHIVILSIVVAISAPSMYTRAALVGPIYPDIKIHVLGFIANVYDASTRFSALLIISSCKGYILMCFAIFFLLVNLYLQLILLSHPRLADHMQYEFYLNERC